MATDSISLRLQRTTVESTHISIPVTADLVVQQPDGTGRIDTLKMVQRAIEIGQASGVSWHVQEQRIEPHPLQTPPEATQGRE